MYYKIFEKITDVWNISRKLNYVFLFLLASFTIIPGKEENDFSIISNEMYYFTKIDGFLKQSAV